MSDIETLRARREALLGRNMSLFYDDPVHLVKGEGVWLWDADGRKYLDCYNNVPHVGHCHPRVVEAICRQAGTPVPPHFWSRAGAHYPGARIFAATARPA